MVEITSPNFPAEYPNRAQIMWFVRAPVNHIAVVRIVEFRTESGYDTLTVYGGSSPVFAYRTLLATLSGYQDIYEDIFSVGSYMWLNFDMSRKWIGSATQWSQSSLEPNIHTFICIVWSYVQSCFITSVPSVNRTAMTAQAGRWWSGVGPMNVSQARPYLPPTTGPSIQHERLLRVKNILVWIFKQAFL